MEEVNNYKWLDLIPQGWKELCHKMIEECEQIDQYYEITDMKEKWGKLDVFSTYTSDKVPEIEGKYEELSGKTCCRCGNPAVKYSAGWILPFCDNCGDDEEKYYKRISLLSIE